MAAATAGHGSIVALLLDAKADVNPFNTVRHAILLFIMKMQCSYSHENWCDIMMTKHWRNVMITKHWWDLMMTKHWRDIMVTKHWCDMWCVHGLVRSPSHSYITCCDCPVICTTFFMMQQNGASALLLAAGHCPASVVTQLLDAKADVGHIDHVRDQLLYDFADV